jgi:5-(carboxyamino)imidazole ribonucleotide synthase
MSTSESNNDSGGAAASEGKMGKPSFSPGATLGILGGGQLGRMSAMAAKAMGYRVAVLDEVGDGPAFSCADFRVTAPFEDREALRRFAASVDVVTVEFENIPVAALEFLETLVPVRPSSAVVRTCQDRVLEKEFLRDQGFPVAPFRVVVSAAELERGLAELGAPSILKTAVLGYDGKGQISLSPGDDAAVVWAMFGAPRGVLEKRVSFSSECSVICARSPSGEARCFPVQANVHRRGILDTTSVPSGLPSSVETEAIRITSQIAAALGVEGLITAEFFVMENGSLIVNELAPRPHNSGHHTLETALTSQFAQHVRAVCNTPLGSPDLRSPGVMLNLLGDLWREESPDWDRFLGEPGCFLHLYGKGEAKPGRKMGHVTLLGDPAVTTPRLLELRQLSAGVGAESAKDS